MTRNLVGGLAEYKAAVLDFLGRDKPQDIEKFNQRIKYSLNWSLNSVLLFSLCSLALFGINLNPLKQKIDCLIGKSYQICNIFWPS